MPKALVNINGSFVHNSKYENLTSITGRYVGILHTVVAYAGFFGALMVGLVLHYEKVSCSGSI